MAEITAAAVKELREITNLPMMECKKALVEAEGDQEKAIAILKENFKKVQAKRADNETSEGRIFLASTADGSEAAMVEIVCESAPVAGGASLEEFGSLCVKQLLEGPGAKSSEELLGQKAPNARKSWSNMWTAPKGRSAGTCITMAKPACCSKPPAMAKSKPFCGMWPCTLRL